MLCPDDNLKVFAGNANPQLAQDIARELGVTLGKILVSRFSDGETRVRIEESIRGADVFIIQPTCPPVNENLMELLIMCDAFKRASAGRIVPIVPYYGYARQDKKINPREPISAKLVADLIRHAGADRIFAIDLHAGQIQGFFDAPVDHLPAGPLIARYLRSKGLYDGNIVVVSPDVGGVERATMLAEELATPLAIIAKRRPEPNRAEVLEIIGDVQGKVAIMIDDMIDTAGSITEGARALKERGAREIYACATHGILSGNAVERLAAAPITEVVITDTIPVPPEKRIPKLTVLSVATLCARAICRIHRDESVSQLYETF
ncbi:MAG: ribose-phosphate pyrophosphokinase [Abditibacteriales bacterium]|nr:ribose-phosphate pyrophosphokinase [Abditibacteriales bacterium]MDW8365720.1 ribose-phosphate pyrophosphokinase [Abditibacteriales bacterium]